MVHFSKFKASGSGSTFGTNTDRLTKVETAAEGDWPWQSAVYRNGVFVCGGTLIASRWVLTAAHCVGAFGRIDSNGSLAVIVGDLHREFNEAKEQRYDVEQVTIHPDYSSSTKQNDIALLRLENAAALSDKTKTATIPNRNATAKEGSSCYVTGNTNMVCLFMAIFCMISKNKTNNSPSERLSHFLSQQSIFEHYHLRH